MTSAIFEFFGGFLISDQTFIFLSYIASPYYKAFKTSVIILDDRSLLHNWRYFNETKGGMVFRISGNL